MLYWPLYSEGEKSNSSSPGRSHECHRKILCSQEVEYLSLTGVKSSFHTAVY